MKRWTYEKCKEEALKFESKSDFKMKSNSAYSTIIRNKWYELLSDLESKILPRGYWGYENCLKHSKECNNILEFEKKYPGATKSIRKNKWNEILDNIRSVKCSGHWTYENCKTKALEYDNIKNFRKENGGAYYAIHINKWCELTEHMKFLPNFYQRLIYVYEFSDNNCYVGLTCDIERRKWQHLNDINSSVYKHIKKTNLYPKLIIKTELLDIKESINTEKINWLVI